ncbi:MAG: hypothetical protein GX036_00385 [Firmicutes bacterium]|nr:hypothetical protein [Bacillota bacterium]
MVLDHGQIKPGIGGGSCQLTNLIYWLTLHTPLRLWNIDKIKDR